MLKATGILIQGLNDRTNYVHSFRYEGINACYPYPLMHEQDAESRKLTEEQMTRKISEEWYEIFEFITDPDLYQRYLKKCRELGIEVRALFVESDYEWETWDGAIPQTEFLGYEYCPIPIDDVVITDLDWCEGLGAHKAKLNGMGLFDTYHDARAFAEDYSQAMKNGETGDGGVEAYICRVSAVVL